MIKSTLSEHTLKYLRAFKKASRGRWVPAIECGAYVRAMLLNAGMMERRKRNLSYWEACRLNRKNRRLVEYKITDAGLALLAQRPRGYDHPCFDEPLTPVDGVEAPPRKRENNLAKRTLIGLGLQAKFVLQTKRFNKQRVSDDDLEFLGKRKEAARIVYLLWNHGVSNKDIAWVVSRSCPHLLQPQTEHDVISRAMAMKLKRRFVRGQAPATIRADGRHAAGDITGSISTAIELMNEGCSLQEAASAVGTTAKKLQERIDAQRGDSKSISALPDNGKAWAQDLPQ